MLTHLLSKLCASKIYPLNVVRIKHKDKSVRVLVVVSPKCPCTATAAHIPHSHIEPMHVYGLDVEANRGDGCHDLACLMTGRSGVSTTAAAE